MRLADRRHALPAVLLALLSAGCATCPNKTAADPTPTTSSAPSGPSLDVRVDADGRAYVAGAPAYKSEDFVHLVEKARAAGDVQSATIVADARVPHGRVIAVKRELEGAGIARVELALAGEPAAEPNPAPAPTPAPPATSPTPPVASSAPEPTPTVVPGQSLPEVKVDNVGLHIGGGPNDKASKQPYLDAIGQHFDEFRACYVKVVEPEKGGTFGVDMRIPRQGGKPSVEQPRTGMKGTEFRDCVTGVFKNIEFGRPAKGPTVISYSLRFSLVK